MALPFASEEFKVVSVAIGGGAGGSKGFGLVPGAATSVTYATEGAYLGDDSLSRLRRHRLASGHAPIRARF